MITHCIWFRQDLRVNDNPALTAARQAGVPVIAVYAVTPTTWQQHDWAPVKAELVKARLQELADELAVLNIPLHVLQLETFSDIPAAIKALCEQHHIKAVFVNRQYAVDERHCEQKVRAACGVNWHAFDGNWLLAPERGLNQQGEPYKVFTAFKRHVLSQITSPTNIQLGHSKAEQDLMRFCQQQVLDYQTQRDFPNLDGTSRLSPYLAQGILSPWQCIAAMMQACQVGSIGALLNLPGPATWLSELIWREFYQHLMWHYPDLSKGKAFKPETDRLRWSQDSVLFAQWCQGKTGFPLVDAGMRQLNETGWMHNRLRMVTAMFLTKTLFIDWRLGERYFMQHLIDGDFAANNGGWQWCASTGTDAVPYFRIFNPTTQSERFDPKGDFIRRYCPELASLSAGEIHDPLPLQRASLGYPEPIVDYKLMRQKVIDAFKTL
jgi:deoxyribodipyrimidine photo-lyase